MPLASVMPQLMERIGTIDWAVGQPQRLDYVELGLPRAPVLLPRQMAEDMRGAVNYIQSETPPGAPLFVYPVAPLFNFLADRPNPTHFDHFLPGALTAADLEERAEALEVRYLTRRSETSPLCPEMTTLPPATPPEAA